MTQKLYDLAIAFAEGRARAERNLDFGDFVTTSYAPTAVYKAAYGGVLNVVATGHEEILATHYGRDMSLGWDGWSWPCRGIYIGEDGRAIVHWVNLAPDPRADGSRFETPGISFLQFDDSDKVALQEDLMDLSAQLRLCEELDEVGKLADALRESWLTPMKKMLVQALS